jgi:hypothetical protein
MKGLTIYAGFIDPYLTLGTNAPEPPGGNRGPELRAGRFFGLPVAALDPGTPGPGAQLPTVTPEHRMVEGISPDPKALQTLRELGFTVGNVVPARGIIRGTSVVASRSRTAIPTTRSFVPMFFNTSPSNRWTRGEEPGELSAIAHGHHFGGAAKFF